MLPIILKISNPMRKYFSMKNFMKLCLFSGMLLLAGLGFANEQKAGVGEIAKNVTGSFKNVVQLFIAVAYLAGAGFSVAALFKFKQHKDNPTQVPLGGPIALLTIAVSLMFIPYFFKPLGETFGAKEEHAGGPTGDTKIPGMK